MADIRINQLPVEPTPSGTDAVAIDGATTRQATVTAVVLAGRPTASQAEAETGTDPTKAMTPLTTAQAITFQGSAQFVPQSRTLTASTGLTGGGNLTANRSFAVDFAAVQAFSTKLTNIDGVSFNAGSMLIATGVNTFASIPVGSNLQVLQIIGGLPTWTNVSAGGDVTGAASSVNGTIVTFNGVTGKAISSGNASMADFLAASKGPMPTISNNVTDATNDIDFSAGACFSSDATSWPMVGSALTKQLDAAWAVGNNAGGRMSAAAIANTTYSCYEIRRPDTGVVDYGFDVSPTAPTLPANYTQYRRIGFIVRASGAIIAFKQDGDDFAWQTNKPDLAAVNPGTTAVTRTLTVPIGARVKAKLWVSAIATANTDQPSTINISDLSVTDQAAFRTTAGSAVGSSGSVVTGNQQGGGVVEVYTNTSGQIRSRLEQSGAGTTLYINTMGWKDSRGKDA